MVKTLGEGSFGKVKLATHRVTKQQVALKIISRKKLISRDMAGRVVSSVFLFFFQGFGGGNRREEEKVGEERRGRMNMRADVLVLCRNARSSICSSCGIRISSSCE